VTDFSRLLAALADGGVEFIVVGGLAATAHGATRLTQDVDVVYSRSADNIRRLVKAMTPLTPYLRGAPRGLPFNLDEETMRRGLNFTLTTVAGDIDLLGEIVGGGGFEDLKSHTVSITLFGKDCLCLDLPTLIHVKRAAGRARDLEAISELEALLEESS
jgi:hypothetical protein